MSETDTGLRQQRVLRPSAINSLKLRIENLDDIYRVSDASWHLYGGLYKVLYRMGESDNPNRLGWGTKRAAALLLQAQVVADVERTPHNITARAFTDLMMPLTERLDNYRAELPDVQKFNSHMLDAYLTTAQSESAMQFVMNYGYEEAMHESLKAAGRIAPRQEN